MSDTLTHEARSERMSRIRGKDTQPELAIRKLVHGMGFRFRLHRKDLPGKPDLVFSARRKVIFVHGCFWHQHTDSGCRLARMPKSRIEFWKNKLEANAARDNRNANALKSLGWEVLVVWECELKHRSSLQSKIESFLRHEIN